MERIESVARRLPLHGIDASRRVEQSALAGLPPFTLVSRAGIALGRLALALAPHARSVWVAVGPGNNGADGIHAALWLARAGKQVVVTAPATSPSLSSPSPSSLKAPRQSAEAIDAWQRLHDAGLAVATEPPTLSEGDLAIDALLGLGASRAPEGALAECIRQLNALPCPVLAADLPSGLDANTGQRIGDDCVRAAHTLSLLTLHPGLFTGLGRDLAGDVWLDTLDIDSQAIAGPDGWLDSSDDAAEFLRPADHGQHKGSFGDVAVVGGAPGMTGAPLLAARAAHAAGAGRVYVSLLDATAAQLDITRPELMFRREWWKGGAEHLQAATVVCGCGGGDAVGEALPALLRQASRLVLDADALNLIAGDAGLQSLLRARVDHGMATVLTPHPLEAARLLGSDTAHVQHDRLAAATALAGRYRCVAVIKGSGTIIAAPGLLPVVNRSGNGALATAGTGDVLAGWLGGVWAREAGARQDVKEAQGDPAHVAPTATTHGSTSTATSAAMKAAVAAVYLHGRAAENAGVATLRAAELVEQLSRDRA